MDEWNGKAHDDEAIDKKVKSSKIKVFLSPSAKPADLQPANKSLTLLKCTQRFIKRAWIPLPEDWIYFATCYRLPNFIYSFAKRELITKSRGLKSSAVWLLAVCVALSVMVSFALCSNALHSATHHSFLLCEKCSSDLLRFRNKIHKQKYEKDSEALQSMRNVSPSKHTIICRIIFISFAFSSHAVFGVNSHGAVFVNCEWIKDSSLTPSLPHLNGR